MIIEEFKKEYGIIGRSKEMRDIIDITMQVAKADISILIYGESGVGKEVFAQAIHSFSPRNEKPLVSVNCGAIPEGILESELFGHKKGSFTGAIETRKGYFEVADGGTLFLDEIAEMPLRTQVKLLRAIETQEFMKIGAETVTSVDVRIIAATNKDLQKEVDTGKFREDLYFRLKAVTLSIPPLRKRKGDIEELAYYFITKYSESSKRKPPRLTDEALEFLKEYNWPGNIRELKNTLESAIAISRTDVLDVPQFINLLNVQVEETDHRNLPIFLKRTPEEVDREILYRALFEIKKDILEIKDLVLQRQMEVKSSTENDQRREVIPIDQLEKEAIKNALNVTRGNKREAAKKLSMSERTLYRKIKEYNIYND